MELYLAPGKDDTVTVNLNLNMVRGMRAYNDDDPAATNDQLADQVEALLAAGKTTVKGLSLSQEGKKIDLKGQEVYVLLPEELVRLSCPELCDEKEAVVFCASDCQLEKAPVEASLAFQE